MIAAVSASLRHSKHLARVEQAATAASRRSAVAIILRDGPSGSAQIMYVLRASSANDAWSGQVAFPGGRRQADDADDLAAAIRETHEEVGLRLAPPAFELLGQLPERHRPRTNSAPYTHYSDERSHQGDKYLLSFAGR